MTYLDTTAQPLDVAREPGTSALLRVKEADGAAGWAAGARDELRAALAEHGAVMVRGLGLRDADGVAEVLRGLAVEPVTEREAFAARRTHSPGVYSSSAWPPNQPMCMHHELSYTHGFPGLLLFACLSEPATGGATGLADAADVLGDLPAGLTERFERDGWLLTRSYNGEIGATVAEAFGTDDRETVERYCQDQGISCDWQPDGGLRTTQHRGAVASHPADRRRCWFNQIAFLNEWTLAPEVREYLVDEYGPDGLPFNTRYGNGDPIGEEVVRTINAAYEKHTVRRPWEAGDLLLVDNVRTAHSREAYEGPRDVVVAMAAPARPDTRAPSIQEGPR
ncbi:TauD/TfdA family dioxygenase [Streptomyces sp. NBC_01341]|uniref:TauD/TfdA family dioxygenase n=1 Tax=Streptomyces sp. NBC_01341 TaxID=2903831 RepID=UPI002E0F6954|nr:TauD/TfdA family dioxygenase [Streptomyces sp. NBC_01341]